jgi:hypothetical protein
MKIAVNCRRDTAAPARLHPGVDRIRAGRGGEFGTDRVLRSVGCRGSGVAACRPGSEEGGGVPGYLLDSRRLHSIPPLSVALHGSAFTAPRSVALRLTRRARSGTDFGPGFGPRAAAGRRHGASLVGRQLGSGPRVHRPSATWRSKCGMRRACCKKTFASSSTSSSSVIWLTAALKRSGSCAMSLARVRAA